MKSKVSQVIKVMNHLKEGKSITSLEAFEKWRITRLSAVIHILRHKHKLVIDSINKGGYAEYVLGEG